jgi:hypothetical protein
MVRLIGLVVLAIAMNGENAFAQVKLEWKYQPGSNHVTETDTKTHQILTLAGSDIETRSSTFIVSTKAAGQRDNDGLLPIEEKVSVLQSEIALPGGITLQFDSANPDKKADNPLLEPIMERLRLTFKHPSTTILDGKNNIKEIKFPQGVAESANEANKSLFDPMKRKKAAEQGRQFLPEETVKPGDTWERSTDADFGSGQTMSFRTKYTYAGTIDKDGKSFDKITANTFDVSYSVDQANTTFKVSKSDLKVTESEETILFDREGGFVQQLDNKTRIQGPLTLVIGSMELDGKLDLTIEVKTKRQK